MKLLPTDPFHSGIVVMVATTLACGIVAALVEMNLPQPRLSAERQQQKADCEKKGGVLVLTNYNSIRGDLRVCVRPL